MKIRVCICDSGEELQKFLNGINVDENLVQIMQSSYTIGYSTRTVYTVVYKSRW
jgi:hypothetical protein